VTAGGGGQKHKMSKIKRPVYTIRVGVTRGYKKNCGATLNRAEDRVKQWGREMVVHKVTGSTLWGEEIRKSWRNFNLKG